MLNRLIKILNTDSIHRKLIVIIPTIILLSGIIMSSYGWFLMNIIGNDSATLNVVKAADLKLSYVDGSALNEQNVYPNWQGTKTFTVTNTGDAAVTYKIAWRELNNEFYYRQYLVYSASSTNGGGNLIETQIPDSGSHILIMGNVSIAPGVTQAYTITFQYKDSAGNQNADQAKTLGGRIEILDGNSSTNTPSLTTGNTPQMSVGQIVQNVTLEEIMQEYYPVNSIYTSFSNTNPSDLFGGTWVSFGQGKTLVGVDPEDAAYSTSNLTGGSKTHLHTTQEHTLTTDEIPSHVHTIAAQTISGGNHNHSMGGLWSGGSGGKISLYIKSSGRNSISHNTESNPNYAPEYYRGSHGHTLPESTTSANTTTESAHDHGDTTTASSMQPYVTVYMWKRTA